MMTTLTITLPHTPRCLSPNAKVPLTQRGGHCGEQEEGVCQTTCPDNGVGCYL